MYGIKYLVDPSVKPKWAYVLVTLKCNSRCRHCYIEAGPERKESLDLESLKRVIDEVSKCEIPEIQFSGGECTLKKENLFSALKYAKNKRRKTGYPKEISVQTNGSWAVDDKKTKDMLIDFHDVGTDHIGIASFDRYHAEFMSLDRARKAYYMARDMGFSVNLHGAGRINPVGRAKREVPKDEWGKWMCNQELTAAGLSISPHGDVYPCCWQATPPMGNILEENLDTILKRARNDDFFKTLGQEGFSGLRELLGIEKDEFDKKVDELGECGYCYELFKEDEKDE
jgi:MoaA/NifB/PqqE/SkfB family radical SAM enzyme